VKKTHKQIIREAYLALAAYSSPSLTEEQQKKEFERCWDLLASVVFEDVEDESR
jgi:hypothetical protein